jgi:hypothetical protein
MAPGYYEGLLPRLWRFYDREMSLIASPLVRIERATPDRFTEINELNRNREAAVRAALRDHDWHGYIFLHERPYRLRALTRCLRAALGNDEIRRNEVIRMVWSDFEFNNRHSRLWRRVWMDTAPTGDEAAALSSMPNPLPIFRGVGDRRGWRGLSWTRERAQAERFATRFSDNKFVVSGVVSRQDIRAYLTERNEAEIIAFPSTPAISR